MLPTVEQGSACIRVCNMLSNYCRNIELFRFNQQTGMIYIFCSDELQIIIPKNGIWRFLNES
ncbi:DUF6888 family protein [Phormidesmis priestleyi]